jgi:hypothetical protein
MAENTAQALIIKGRSSPTNPDAPSFLTTLPPEIRNWIYELLFIHDDPLRVTAVHRWTHYMDMSLVREEVARAMALLRSCRQVYHEAVRIIYSRNHFTFIPQDRKLSCLENWCSTISHQVLYLSKVTVELYDLSSNGWETTGSYNLLPVLRILWMSKISDLNIFVRSKPSWDWISLSGDNVAAAMNSALDLLGRQDNLNLRRFLRIPNSLKSVKLDAEGREGSVVFGGAYHSPTSRDPVDVAFTISHDDNYFMVDSKLRPMKLFQDYAPPWSNARPVSLPEHIFSDILDYATYVPVGVNVDLATSEFTNKSLGLFWTSRELRLRVMESFISNNHFTFAFTSSSDRISAISAASINDWPFSLPSDGNIYWRICPWIGHSSSTVALAKSVKFIITFRPPPGVTGPEDMRINAADFVSTTLEARASTVVCCRIHECNNNLKQGTESIFSLSILRMRLFIMLSYLVEAKPWRRGRACPPIYCDGHGYVVDWKQSGHKGYRQLAKVDALQACQANATEVAKTCADLFEHFHSQKPLRGQIYDRTNVHSARVKLLELWGHLHDLICDTLPAGDDYHARFGTLVGYEPGEVN